MRIQGRLVSGRRTAVGLTQLEWVRRQFVEKLGIDAYPGTLNLIPETAADLEQWAALKKTSGQAMIAPDPQWCNARCYPVRIGDRVPGAIVFPETAGYPEEQIEIIAALPLREFLSVREGDRLSIEVSRRLAVRGVIFDIDGTLVDSIDAYRRIAELAAEAHGLQVEPETVRRALNTGRDFWEMIVPSGRPDRMEMIEQMRREAIRHWRRMQSKEITLFQGVQQTLKTLQSQGMRLGIVTGSHDSAFLPLRNAGLINVFAAIVTGNDVGRRKPDPEGLLKCVDALGVKPGEAVYVGDTPLDVQASRAGGLASVAVLSGAGNSAELSAAGPDWIICSHARLPGILEPL